MGKDINTKIALFGFVNDTNIGDQVICDTYNNLIQNEYKNVSTSCYDLIYDKNIFARIVLKLSKFISRKLYMLISVQFAKCSYMNMAIGNDVIVVVGGGMIKYKAQECYVYMPGLIQAAEKLNIPIILNSVGVEGYDETDFRCKYLKRNLNRDIVKMITTRDDISTLGYYTTNQNIYTDLTADPALFADITYDIYQNIDSNAIGVGLIRGGIFQDYGIDFSERQIIDMYVGIINKLEDEGRTYVLFTNGLYADYELGLKVLSELGKTIDELPISVPNNSKELVQIISSCKAIIASRMHATIIAYSLNIPAIGLVWNDKLPLFGQNINSPENFLTIDKFDADTIYSSLLKSIDKGYDNERREVLKQKIINSISMIKQYTS